MSVWGAMHKTVREGRGPRCANCDELLEVEQDDKTGVRFDNKKIYKVDGKLYCVVCVFQGLVRLKNG